MRKILNLISLLTLLSIYSCDSLYFSTAMPHNAKVVSDFPMDFTGEYRMLSSEEDSSYASIRIEENSSRRYTISFSDSGFFQLGFILDLGEKSFIALDKGQKKNPAPLSLKEYKGDYYLSWYKEEYEAWQLLRFKISRDSLIIDVPQFKAELLSNYRDVDQNDYLTEATDEELSRLMEASESFGFERTSEPKTDPTYFILGAIALILLIVFFYLSRRRAGA